VFKALKVLLCSGDDASPQHWSVLRAMHTLNSRKNYIRLLGRLSPIHSMSLRGAQGLMWGTRGAFPLGAAMIMVVLVDAGRWRLTSDQPTVAIVPKEVRYQELRARHRSMTVDCVKYIVNMKYAICNM
jgi:hypothetical protein